MQVAPKKYQANLRSDGPNPVDVSISYGRAWNQNQDVEKATDVTITAKREGDSFAPSDSVVVTLTDANALNPWSAGTTETVTLTPDGTGQLVGKLSDDPVIQTTSRDGIGYHQQVNVSVNGAPLMDPMNGSSTFNVDLNAPIDPIT